MATQTESERLKIQGNEAFVGKEYERALQLYQQAVELDSANHFLWANISATKVETKDYKGAIDAAKKAIALRPRWAKGYFRQGVALAADQQTFRAIEAFHKALKLEANSRSITERLLALEKQFYSPRYANTPERTDEEYSHPTKFPLDFAKALADSRGIELPENVSLQDATQVIMSNLKNYPNMPPAKYRFLFLPEPNPNVRQSAPRNVEFNSLDKDAIHRLMDCQCADHETLYDEDLAEQWRGNREGIPYGHIYRTWEFMMDDSCLLSPGRKYNPLASQVLHRPETFGPILVLRTTHLKADECFYVDGVPTTLIGFEVVTMEELASEEWRIMREEWKALRSMNPWPIF